MAQGCMQLPLALAPTWGGHRPGAGRKPTPGRRPGVPHRTRPPHLATHPVHATLRTTSAVRCLRSGRAFPAVLRAVTAASRDGFRIIHFSVQDDHVHLLVEADSRERLSGGVRGVAIRIARAVNRALGRRGAVFDDRYHARALATPREVRHALVYVLMNRKKHDPGTTGLDPCSSARWFHGWREAIRVSEHDNPVVQPRSWLAAVGWRRHGLISITARPRS